MAQGDLIQITDFQTFQGEELLNVFYYRQTTVGVVNAADLEDLAAAFVTDVVTPITAVQSQDLNHFAIEVRNLTDNLTFHLEPLTAVNGLLSVSATANLPSYMSLGFKLIRESLATRNGYKRIAGLTEAQVTGNTYVLPGGTIIADIEAGLAADLNISFPHVFEPVIVKRPIVPPVAIPYVYASIGGAQLVGLGTQNSRKP